MSIQSDVQAKLERAWQDATDALQIPDEGDPPRLEDTVKALSDVVEAVSEVCLSLAGALDELDSRTA